MNVLLIRKHFRSLNFLQTVESFIVWSRNDVKLSVFLITFEKQSIISFVRSGHIINHWNEFPCAMSYEVRLLKMWRIKINISWKLRGTYMTAASESKRETYWHFIGSSTLHASYSNKNSEIWFELFLIWNIGSSNAFSTGRL